MYAEDLLTALQIGVPDRDLSIESARSQECGIEDVGAIGRGDNDDAVVLGEAVHLDEQLIERLLTLFVTERIATAIAAHGIELVDEDDARLVATRLLEQLAHARGAHAGIHLHEV